MRILVLGAGATGGYFGGRLAAAGVDVTFLVRPARAASLRQHGLAIVSPSGDVQMPVGVVTADAPSGDYDVVLLTCKAYDLDDAIAAIGPALSGTSRILPVLNGMRHLDRLDAAFGAERVLGGVAHITAALDAAGTIHHLKDLHVLTFGPRHPNQAPFCAALCPVLQRGRFDVRLSERITQDMWEKWVLIAALAGSTCLMRASLCDILAAPDGEALILGMIAEAAAIAAAQGYTPRPAALDRIKTLLIDPRSTMAASMRRDVEAGHRTEVDHILGDLLERGRECGIAAPLLGLACLHVQAATFRQLRQDDPAMRAGDGG